MSDAQSTHFVVLIEFKPKHVVHNHLPLPKKEFPLSNVLDDDVVITPPPETPIVSQKPNVLTVDFTIPLSESEEGCDCGGLKTELSDDTKKNFTGVHSEIWLYECI